MKARCRKKNKKEVVCTTSPLFDLTLLALAWRSLKLRLTTNNTSKQ